MAKKKTKKVTKKDKPGLLDDPSILDIVAGLSLSKIVLAGGRWTTTLQINSALPRVYNVYKIALRLNEKPYLKRIEDLERSMDGSLFKDDNAEKRSLMEKVSDVRDELDELRDTCNTFEFSAYVDALKYNNGVTLVTFRIPDDVIAEFNKHKHRMELYEIVLTPAS